MPSFRYKAVSASGTVISGVLEAASENAAVEELRRQGHFPVAATAVAPKGWLALLHRQILVPRRAPFRELAIATQEIATLHQAGLPLDRCLESVAGLADTRMLRQPLTSVMARLREGTGFSDAMAAERCFPGFYISMARAGEMGGNLEDVLLRLAEYLARAQSVRDTVISAMIYPAILLTTAGFAIVAILVFVLPEFEPLFRNAGQSLPLATRIVMAAGQALTDYGWMLGLAVAGAVIGGKLALRNPVRRRKMDGMLLRLPLFGPLLTAVELERFCRTLGTLLTCGVPLPTALGITKDTLVNEVLKAAVVDTATSLREGDALADRLNRTGVFPSLTIDLIRVGEQGGKLDQMLLRQAEQYDRSVRNTVDRLLAMLVPALTIFLGIVVAGLVSSMLVAILSINDLVGK